MKRDARNALLYDGPAALRKWLAENLHTNRRARLRGVVAVMRMRWTGFRFSTALALSLFVGLQGTTPAHAKPEFLTAFASRYPTATRLFTCGTCHVDFNGPQDDEGEILNLHGKAFEEAHGNDDPEAALAAIEQDDPDDDGSASIVEITTLAGFLPGYSCETYTEARNAPLNIALFVDPASPGCEVASTTVPAETTTTLIVTTTTGSSASTTSTTLGVDGCAQPISSGAAPLASDCLYILRAALNLESCAPACLCAPKGSLPITATDALICLKRALGQDVALQCPCSATTTVPESTTTTVAEPTTTLPEPTTTTTTTTTSTTITTTTTTLGGSVAAGQAIYDTRCSACHMAGGHDTQGFAPDLAGSGSLVVNNLSAIDPMMAGITLTDRQVLDVAAFLDSL